MGLCTRITSGGRWEVEWMSVHNIVQWSWWFLLMCVQVNRQWESSDSGVNLQSYMLTMFQITPAVSHHVPNQCSIPPHIAAGFPLKTLNGAGRGFEIHCKGRGIVTGPIPCGLGHWFGCLWSAGSSLCFSCSACCLGVLRLAGVFCFFSCQYEPPFYRDT
jgi:hypothetical protein